MGHAQLVGFQCGILAYFIITFSEPLTLEHQTGWWLVNWKWHIRRKQPWPMLSCHSGIWMEWLRKTITNKHYLPNTREKCFLFDFSVLLLWFILIRHLHHTFLLFFSMVLCFIFHSKNKVLANFRLSRLFFLVNSYLTLVISNNSVHAVLALKAINK